MDALPIRMREKLRDLVTGLVLGQYEDLERRGLSGINGAEGLKDAIEGYPGQITMPPPEAFEQIRELVELKGKAIPETERVWMIVFTLWYDGQEADLTLEAYYVEPDVGEPSIYVEMIVS